LAKKLLDGSVDENFNGRESKLESMWGEVDRL
jgi:hypothetical protein